MDNHRRFLNFIYYTQKKYSPQLNAHKIHLTKETIRQMKLIKSLRDYDSGCFPWISSNADFKMYQDIIILRVRKKHRIFWGSWREGGIRFLKENDLD